MRTISLPILCLLFLGLANTANAQAFLQELLDPWPDVHSSPHGTPHIHALNVEPAFLDRDLLIDYRLSANVPADADEQELEFELEWALTKRLGLIAAVPVIGIDPEAGNSASGFGDLAFGGRAVLVNRHRFLLSANLELETPTGDAASDLGRGEAALSPTIVWWLDLGNWTVFQGQLGPETGLQSGETELVYRFALTRSWRGPVLFPCCGARRHDHDVDRHDDHNHHSNGHHESGLITLYFEPTGTTNLTAPDEPTMFELTTGIGYAVTHSLELRTAVGFPLFRPQRFDGQFVFSAIRHF